MTRAARAGKEPVIDAMCGFAALLAAYFPDSAFASRA
jgi:hypothetical protein